MADYSSVLAKAVAELKENTPAQRRALYDRAREAILERLRAINPPLPDAVIAQEQAALRTAIESVEATYRDPSQPAPPPVEAGPSDERRVARVLSQRRGPVLYAVAALCAAIVVIAGVLVVSILPKRLTLRPAETAAAGPVNYVFLQQPVYYRSEYPEGTIIIDKSQYFMYLIRSNTVAWRYGIGMGPECIDAAGLYRVLRKEIWPGMQGAVDRVKQLDAEFAGNPSGPALGARAFYFGTVQRIHGTNIAASVGRDVTAGCVRLSNDSIIGLFDRVPVDGRIIVRN